MMAGFTPGPWVPICNDVVGGLRYWSIYPDLLSGYRGEVCAAHSAEHIGGITVAERDANARLIAAAPDLFEALREAAEEIADLRKFAGDNGAMIDEPRPSYADAALAKAEGKSA